MCRKKGDSEQLQLDAAVDDKRCLKIAKLINSPHPRSAYSEQPSYMNTMMTYIHCQGRKGQFCGFIYHKTIYIETSLTDHLLNQNPEKYKFQHHVFVAFFLIRNHIRKKVLIGILDGRFLTFCNIIYHKTILKPAIRIIIHIRIRKKKISTS